MVHEGNFFLHLAAACDIIYDELSETDHKNIVAIFRILNFKGEGSDIKVKLEEVRNNDIEMEYTQ
ncbi:hypothetical protein [Saccharicrinis fermentans]|uniref:Uncharacterized protein n=1 Tax=Saccharicrinis fermentans DSM 9555 = JCM 21142 TaxID=869213 RepID=W7Y2J5_9BACT|nr:hypothetical protein [Saccharicrinis fermentans]GAF02177.1 hypothetical protein JCM21142_3805 [Saccharicrinis fermentans DSM 9555 = JCM 21142]